MPIGTFTSRGAPDTGGDKAPCHRASSLPGEVSLSSEDQGQHPFLPASRSGAPSRLVRSGPGPARQPWPRPQVLAASLFTSSSWTSFQTWIEKKTTEIDTQTQQQGQEEH